MTTIATPPKLQFIDANGVPISGGKLYTYAAGLATPIATYTNYAGTLNTNPIILDTLGECDLWYGTAAVKLVLHDANDVPIWEVDNLNHADGATLAALAAANGSTLIGYKLSGATTVQLTAYQKFSQIVSVVDYGADPTGVADSSTAITNALSAMSNPGCLWFPQGVYLVNSEILINYSTPNGSGKHLHFDGCEIRPGNGSMNIIHWADSHGSISGRVKFTSNGKTGITGFSLTPVLGNLNTTVVNQNFNQFMAYMEFIGLDEAVVLMAGLPITGTASGCWYNTFASIFSTSCKRSIWLKDNLSVDGANSGPNSNVFNSFIVNGSSNTGIQIDAGGGNIFYTPQLENITTGSSPNATPVGIKIAATIVNGGLNNNNTFYSPHWENVTAYMDNNAPSTKVFVSNSEIEFSYGQLVPVIDYYPSVLTQKGSIVNSVYGIVTSASNIRGLWLFDAYGATTSITDHSDSGRTATLRDASLVGQNASNWGPIVNGLAQGLKYCDQSHLWDTQSAGFNFGNGATDSPFSIVTLVIPLLTANTEIVAKDDLTTGSSKREFSFSVLTSGALISNMLDNSASASIGRTTAGGVVTAGTLQLISQTYSGSSTNAGVKIYVNASRVDNTDFSSGVYTAMEALSAKVGSYRLSTATVAERGFRGAIFFKMIVAEELTALQIRRLYNLLIPYAGGNI